MDIFAEYLVAYEINRPGFTGGMTQCALTRNYSDFEDIRRMIAIRRGVDTTDIVVVGLQLVRHVDVAVADQA